jgi:hypothetical protein
MSYNLEQFLKSEYNCCPSKQGTREGVVLPNNQTNDTYVPSFRLDWLVADDNSQWYRIGTFVLLCTDPVLLARFSALRGNLFVGKIIFVDV